MEDKNNCEKSWPIILSTLIGPLFLIEGILNCEGDLYFISGMDKNITGQKYSPVGHWVLGTPLFLYIL